MKQGALKGIIQFVLTLGIMILLELFFFSVLSHFGLHFSGSMQSVMNLVKYIIILAVTLIVYHGDIFLDKSKFNRSLLTSLIVAVVTFIVMVVFTVLIRKILNGFDITVGYGFTNYFNGSMTFERALDLIINCFIKPCLVCSIFVLGISNIIRKEFVAMLLSGIAYGAYLAFMNHVPFDMNLVYLLIPVVNVVSLSYLYKSSGNIFTCIVTYIIYFLFGSVLLSYIL